MFVGGGGADLLDGGTGVDTASYEASSKAIAVNLDKGVGTLGNANGDRFVDVENVIGSIRGDVIIGSSQDNVLDGRQGTDILRGRGGNDTLLGGDGNDILRGDAGDDIIVGGFRNDILRGGSGDDFLNGGPGNDTLYGGGGHDIFVFRVRNGDDTIKNFDLEKDTIRIVNSQIEISDIEITSLGTGSLINYQSGTIFLEDIDKTAASELNFEFI